VDGKGKQSWLLCLRLRTRSPAGRELDRGDTLRTTRRLVTSTGSPSPAAASPPPARTYANVFTPSQPRTVRTGRGPAGWIGRPLTPGCLPCRRSIMRCHCSCAFHAPTLCDRLGGVVGASRRRRQQPPVQIDTAEGWWPGGSACPSSDRHNDFPRQGCVCSRGVGAVWSRDRSPAIS
jgi:hypothetical protein